MSVFNLEVLTPEKVFFSDKAEMIILATSDGELGVMASHSPLVAALVEGELRIKQNGQWRSAAASDGFALITADKVNIMLQSVEWPEDIDAARAEAARQLASEQLLTAQSKREYVLAKSSLARAMTRLSIKNRSR